MAVVEADVGGGRREGQCEDWNDLNEGFGRIALGEAERDANATSGHERDVEEQRVLDLLELFFSTPEFTDAVRHFIESNEADFVFVEEGAEQPLSNYDLYLKYTKLIEDLLEAFLQQHGIGHEDVAKLCVAEKAGGNKASFSLDYIIASTQYDKFLQMMADFKSLHAFEIEDDDLFGWGIGEEGREDGTEDGKADGE